MNSNHIPQELISSLNEPSELASPVQLSEYLWCITAPNPSPMTASGTNTYLIAKDGLFVVIDPGPDDDRHTQAILQFVGEANNISKILVTHMHTDHSPAALPLAELSGAPIYGSSSVSDEFQDATCQPTDIIEHNQCIEFNGLTVQCLHTPAHTDGGMSIIIDTLSGKAVITGFCVINENFNPPIEIKAMEMEVIPPGTHVNVYDSYDIMLKIKEMADILLPLHEPEFASIDTIG